MIHSLHFLSQILLLFIISSTDEQQLYDDNLNDSIKENTSVTNASLSMTNTSSFLILNALLTSDTINNEFTSFSSDTSQKIESVYSLVDQINFYRNSQILSRIKQCDSNMKLNDLCEIYSIDNNTNSLIRQSNIDFYTLEDLFDSIVDRLIVQKLNKYCLSTNWCLGNLSENDIQLMNDVIQNRGHAFCSLEQCHSRILVFIETCPTLSNTNISIPTLKLLPMLCDLYKEQQNWNSSQCIEEIVHLFHIFYAFWPQIEACYNDNSIGIDGCESECQRFDNILNKIENECNGNASFLSRMPMLSLYQSINLKEICYRKSISTRSPFIYSVKQFFSANQFWYRIYEKPIYMISFLIILIFLVICFSLCFDFMLKSRLNCQDRRADDNYEYTRLHHPSFELGTSTEIRNTNSITEEMIDDESQVDANDRFRSSEYQRLLFVNS